MTSVAVGTTKQPFFFYFVACLIYLLMSIVSSVGIGASSRWAERSQRATEGAPADQNGAAGMMPDLLVNATGRG